MDLKDAVRSYLFSERAKSELIICSQLGIALAGFPDNERPGAKRMLIMVLEQVRSEIQFGYQATGLKEFRNAMELLSEAISLTESDQPGPASLKMSEAISAVTTAAQGAWEVLSQHGLI
jgi:hypothetical protein